MWVAVAVTRCRHATYGTHGHLTRPIGIDTFVHHTLSASRYPAVSYELSHNFSGQMSIIRAVFKSGFQAAGTENGTYTTVPLCRSGVEAKNRATGKAGSELRSLFTNSPEGATVNSPGRERWWTGKIHVLCEPRRGARNAKAAITAAPSGLLLVCDRSPGADAPGY